MNLAKIDHFSSYSLLMAESNDQHVVGVFLGALEEPEAKLDQMISHRCLPASST